MDVVQKEILNVESFQGWIQGLPSPCLAARFFFPRKSGEALFSGVIYESHHYPLIIPINKGLVLFLRGKTWRCFLGPLDFHELLWIWSTPIIFKVNTKNHLESIFIADDNLSSLNHFLLFYPYLGIWSFFFNRVESLKPPTMDSTFMWIPSSNHIGSTFSVNSFSCRSRFWSPLQQKQPFYFMAVSGVPEFLKHRVWKVAQSITLS